MNLNFTKIIDEIQTALSSKYVPGMIRWADETKNNAASNAMDRFDKALSEASEKLAWDHAKAEAQVYKETMLGLIREYKIHKSINEANDFLSAVKGA